MNILITGGASGLGEAITKTLAKDKNNKVYFTYNSSKVNAERIVSEFQNSTSINCDFRDSISLKIFLDKISQLDLDVLVNNAYNGDFLKSHFHKISSEHFLNDFKHNIIPTIEITQTLIKKFRKQKRGKIITMLSAALLNLPPIGSSVYIANKAYLEMLTKVWANENARFNIVSNSISPSFMKTALTEEMDERIVEEMINNHPQGKLLTVTEVAESVLFMVNSSSQINGMDLVMNAGFDLK